MKKITMLCATHKDNVWIALTILLFISLATAASSALMVTYFVAIKKVVPVLMIAVCMLGVLFSYILVRRHSAKQRRREMMVVATNYLVVILSTILYSVGAFWTVAVLFILLSMLIINIQLAHTISTSLLLHANTLVAMPMAATFNGLMYARNISADWGTLYLTLLSGIILTAVGFIISAIAILWAKYISPKSA